MTAVDFDQATRIWGHAETLCTYTTRAAQSALDGDHRTARVQLHAARATLALIEAELQDSGAPTAVGGRPGRSEQT